MPPGIRLEAVLPAADYLSGTGVIMGEQTPGNARISRGDDLTALAVTAMAALYEAELFDEMEGVRSRVLARGAALFDEVRREDGTWRLAYKPMTELLLLHVREIAVAPRSVLERRAEIAWTLDVTGF
jgi:hypothetical protein